MLTQLINQIRACVFPEYYKAEGNIADTLCCLLHEQQFNKVDEIANHFLAELPEICRLVHLDAESVLRNDPAVEGLQEVVLCYPLTTVMLHYRSAHALYKLGVPLLPRMLTERAHSLTGVDIHPAAQIGESFCIDHGTGVVIGATCIIGKGVMLYQGVTLGAKHFTYDEEGIPQNTPRHPILEDNVTVYSNTSILGRIRIGHDTVIGGNVWLTHDVPACSKVTQSRPKVSVTQPSNCTNNQ